MEGDDRFKLYYILTFSYPHLRQLKPKKLKATFKATKDLHLKGLPNRYHTNSMTRMQGNRYLMDATELGVMNSCISDGYCVDLDTMTAKSLFGLNARYGINNIFVDGEYVLRVRGDGPINIVRGLKVIGQIEFDVKYEICKNGNEVRGRYAQHVGHSVYVLDRDARLYRIEWQDIKDGKYRKTLVKENVENFYVDKGIGLATLNKNDSLNMDDTLNIDGGLNKDDTLDAGHTLTLPSDTVVNLKAKVDSKAAWTIVTCIAKCWIICGEHYHDGHAILASISNKGDIRSILKHKLTSNGYVNNDGSKYAGIYSLHNVFTRGRRGIMLAIERDGCCHLISVAYGRLSKLQSIDSIVNVDVVEDERDRIVMSVTATTTEGEFIAGGFGWNRLISLKLK